MFIVLLLSSIALVTGQASNFTVATDFSLNCPGSNGCGGDPRVSNYVSCRLPNLPCGAGNCILDASSIQTLCPHCTPSYRYNCIVPPPPPSPPPPPAPPRHPKIPGSCAVHGPMLYQRAVRQGETVVGAEPWLNTAIQGGAEWKCDFTEVADRSRIPPPSPPIPSAPSGPPPAKSSDYSTETVLSQMFLGVTKHELTHFPSGVTGFLTAMEMLVTLGVNVFDIAALPFALRGALNAARAGILAAVESSPLAAEISLRNAAWAARKADMLAENENMYINLNRASTCGRRHLMPCDIPTVNNRESIAGTVDQEALRLQKVALSQRRNEDFLNAKIKNGGNSQTQGYRNPQFLELKPSTGYHDQWFLMANKELPFDAFEPPPVGRGVGKLKRTPNPSPPDKPPKPGPEPDRSINGPKGPIPEDNSIQWTMRQRRYRVPKYTIGAGALATTAVALGSTCAGIYNQPCIDPKIEKKISKIGTRIN